MQRGGPECQGWRAVWGEELISRWTAPREACCEVRCEMEKLLKGGSASGGSSL